MSGHCSKCGETGGCDCQEVPFVQWDNHVAMPSPEATPEGLVERLRREAFCVPTGELRADRADAADAIEHLRDRLESALDHAAESDKRNGEAVEFAYREGFGDGADAHCDGEPATNSWNESDAKLRLTALKEQIHDR